MKIRFRNFQAVVFLIFAQSACAVDFATEIIPVFTRAGCNAGACHGAAAGRGEFRLSLLGGDPAADYEAIVYDLEGRRINLAHPEKSLLLGKPTGLLEHGGEVVLDAEGAGAERLRDWVVAGAPRGGKRQLERFDVTPESGTVERVGESTQLRATARFDDGTTEDVTSWTVFAAADRASVEIDAERATAKVLRRGQHVVIARFLDRVVPLTLTLPLSDAAVDLSSQPRANFIDDEILSKLEQLRISVAPRADDATFLRRTTLALTGTLPSSHNAEAYLVDDSSDKRIRLVDRLLASEEFVDYWTFRFATLLRIRALPKDREAARVYHEWLHDQIAAGTSLDEVARAMLTATGDSHEVGPANFARMASDPRAHAELVSAVFLGARLQCANCHNHPLDKWTQDDYHGLAAVFAKVQRGRIVSVSSRGAVTNLRTGEPAIPRLPGTCYLDPEDDCREELAEWLASPDNPQFARATVNRLWAAMMGRGLVEPVDDLRDTNPATHPELLNRLANEFIQHEYDIRHVLRLIARSETFARGEGDRMNAADDRYYSRALRRPLEAEVLADAIAEVTEVDDVYGVSPPGTRAVELFDPATPAESLDILGRCSREMSCEGEAIGGGLPAKLHQLNGELVNRRITDPKGHLHKSITNGKSNEAIVEDFYLRALGRKPTESERSFWQAELNGDNDKKRVVLLEDFVWSLLNSSEFTTNH